MAKDPERSWSDLFNYVQLTNHSYATTDAKEATDTFELICMPGFPVEAEEPGKATLELEVQFNPQVTDAESVASAFDQLLETVMSTPGILDEYGSVIPGDFYVKRKF